ncbi:hypothetical protein ACS0TY_006075 [Phlomoides rotata]
MQSSWFFDCLASREGKLLFLHLLQMLWIFVECALSEISLDGVGIGADGLEETVASLEQNTLFGEISILCNIPQPYTIRLSELCKLLRNDKQSFSNILEIYFQDGRKLLTNLLEGKNEVPSKIEKKKVNVSSIFWTCMLGLESIRN